MQSASPLIVVLGPTAAGKTAFAAQAAHQVNGEIISADSRQVYKNLNIGTGKDYHAYVVNGKTIPYHLIDIAEPTERYHVNRFIKDCKEAIDQIAAKGCIPIMCGGSGLYLQAVLKDYQYTAIPVNLDIREELTDKSLPQLQAYFSQLPKTTYAQIADLSTTKRCIRAIEIATWLGRNSLPEPQKVLKTPLIIGLKNSIEERRKNIANRLDQRLQNGLIDEVQLLLAKGISANQLIYFGLEYKFVTYYLQGQFSIAELKEKLTIAIQQFAKRQMTYFRKMEREGCNIIWLDASLPMVDMLNSFRHHFAVLIKNKN